MCAALGQNAVRVIQLVNLSHRSCSLRCCWFNSSRSFSHWCGSRCGRHWSSNRFLRFLAGTGCKQVHQNYTDNKVLHDIPFRLVRINYGYGPHTGSRASPLCENMRCLTRPSLDTVSNIPRPRASLANIISLPLGAKLGFFSHPPSVRISICSVLKSWVAMKNLPLVKCVYTKPLPSGLWLGE